ncbi:hypothetical protein DRJ19_04405 [Candidatus Woesearchaeota archaeon]|nr:MAG: hypothetical protein DRJ19_04405 [Candidatus Woesearchaeota archaeon]
MPKKETNKGEKEKKEEKKEELKEKAQEKAEEFAEDKLKELVEGSIKKEKSFWGIELFSKTTILSISALLVGIVIGFFWYAAFFVQPCEPQIIHVTDENCVKQPPKITLKLVDIYVLTSSEYEKFSKPNHSVFGFLDRYGIPYNKKIVGIATPEGKSILENYEITELPTAVINADQLKLFASINTEYRKAKNIIERLAKKEGNQYIMREFYLDGKYHFRMLMQPKCQAEKPTLYLFGDPLNPSAIEKSAYVDKLHEQFKDEVEFEYFFNITATDDESYVKDKELALLNAKYFIYARDNGKFWEFKKCFYAKLCDADEDGNVTEEEAINCVKNMEALKEKIPLQEAQLDECLVAVGLDVELAKEDIKKIDRNRLLEEAKQAKKFEVSGLNGWVAVLDCKYIDHVLRIKRVLCKAHPELKACKK